MSATKSGLPTWQDYIQKLIPIGDKILKGIPGEHTPQVVQETWGSVFQSLSQSYFAGVYPDPDYPEFISTFNMAINLFAPVPDYMYTWTPIKDDGIYRIRGYRGTTVFVKMSFLEGYYALDNNKGEIGLADIDSIKQGPDGWFDLILSAKRPAGYDGDWVELPARTTNLLIRSASYDWVKERDPILSIERTDVPAQRPRRTAEELVALHSIIPLWTEIGALRPVERWPDLEAKNLRNNMYIHNYVGMGGSSGQTYLEGLYDLADSEALILETDVPKCRYWSFFVVDNQMATIGWMNRQSSLNGFQAKLDSDGKFRAVICPQDPGVPNWLDTGGHNYGIIHGRWHETDSSPEPVFNKVKLADLRNHLPKDTPVVSSEERDAVLRERRMGAQFRRKW